MPTDVLFILKEKGLHVTDARQKILRAFYESEVSMSLRDIHRLLNNAFDRVTIYRTLDLFVEKGIIHIIPSMNHLMQYALIKPGMGSKGYLHHLHFLCEDCGKTICLDMMPVPVIQLPEGFAGKQTDVMIKGVCNNCQSA